MPAVLVLFLASCADVSAPKSSGCGHNGFVIAPTATRPRDPDLFSPPEPPPTDEGTIYCPTPVGAATGTAQPAQGFVATDVVNLSLDIGSQAVQSVAAGDDMIGVGWVDEGVVYVALARGGNHFQVRRVDGGSRVSLAFSPANRLHVAYEQDGNIFYRAADQGTHPADISPIVVGPGRNSQVVVDELNWAHVLYERDGGIYKAKHLSGEQWLTQFVTQGADLTVRAFYNEQEVTFFGIPAGAYWFGLFLSARHDGQVRVLRYLSWFNLWQQVATFAVPPGEELSGAVGLDFHAVSEDEAWVYASWVTKRPNTAPPLPLYAQPFYETVNPLYPDQLANPHQIYEGLNAVRWRSEGVPFNAGLQQQVSVPNQQGNIQFQAYGLAEINGAAGGPADLRLRIGIDPTGGNSPESPSVVWSEANASTAFTRFAVSAPAAGGRATLFLHATLNMPGARVTVVWDAAQAQNAGLDNGGFEGPFVAQSTLTVPADWSAYHEDSGNSPLSGRDVYTVYAAWSGDGGSSWSVVTPVVANRDVSGGTTGAIRPDVYPVITTATEPASAAFFYVYEAGDPPPGTSFLRFGRPAMTTCELGSTECSDPPGAPLMSRDVVRPGYRLLLAPDPFHQERSMLIWDALQTDYASKDVYATYVTVR